MYSLLPDDKLAHDQLSRAGLVLLLDIMLQWRQGKRGREGERGRGREREGEREKERERETQECTLMIVWCYVVPTQYFVRSNLKH